MLIKALAMIFFSPIMFANSSGPPKAKANNAPLNQNCTGCHNGTVNSSNGRIIIENLSNNYIPNEQYALILKVLGENSSGYGFQLAVQAGNAPAGSFLLDNSNNNTELNGNYLQHSKRTISGEWRFIWIAPDSNVGDITFSASGLAADGNGSNSGDKTYTMSKVLAHGLLCGDLDENGSHNVSDIVKLVNYILEIGDRSCILLADINKDERINVSDIVTLVNYILKLETAEINCSC